jgi:mannose-6-phosphate isomerase-like protein (cupin superfamily)
MVIKAANATKIPIEEGVIFDYPLPTEEMGLAFETLNGRCPPKGKYKNAVCHETYFIINGSASFFIDGNVYSVEPKDIVQISPESVYYLTTDQLEVIIISRPNWYEKQFTIIND